MVPWYQVVFYDEDNPLPPEEVRMVFVTKARWNMLNNDIIKSFSEGPKLYKIINRRSFVTRSELFANTYFLMLDIKQVL